MDWHNTRGFQTVRERMVEWGMNCLKIDLNFNEIYLCCGTSPLHSAFDLYLL